MNPTLKLVFHLFIVAVLAAIVSALISCAAPRYHNPDKTYQEWHADVAECQSKSWGANGIFQHQTFDFCMKGEGWTRAD
jgi:hypothetical protein